MLFTDTATIYNHYYDEDTEKWQRTVVKGCQWSHSKIVSSVSGDTISQIKAESITFDFSRDYKNPVYVNPQVFKALTNKEGFWTLDSANKQDVIVYGEVTQELGTTYKLSQLRADNQYCGTVSEVADNRNRTFLKNIKVVAK